MVAAGSTYHHDIAVSCIVFAITGVIINISLSWCERKVPKWDQIPLELRSRICVEMAVLPSRVAMGIIAFPIVVSAFTPMEQWCPEDTERALLACSIMTGSYLLDLSVERTDILSTIHHCMGPALLLWIRTSFSSFTYTDALLCRILILFVFFGGCVGGSASSGAVFCLRIGKKYLDKVTLYNYYAICLATLTASTVTSCFTSVLYISYWFPQFFDRFGITFILPVVWEGFECYLQWRWLFRYHVIESRFWTAQSTEVTPSATGLSTPTSSSMTMPMVDIKIAPPPLRVISSVIGRSVFPSQTVPLLKVLAVTWTAIYITLYYQIYAFALAPVAHPGESLSAGGLEGRNLSIWKLGTNAMAHIEGVS